MTPASQRVESPRYPGRFTLLPLINLPGIVLPGKRRLAQIFHLYVTLNMPLADAYVAVETKRLGLTDIVSFDKEFDKVPNITRIEP
jgi:predicted nucleic acid-binding protein